MGMGMTQKSLAFSRAGRMLLQSSWKTSHDTPSCWLVSNHPGFALGHLNYFQRHGLKGVRDEGSEREENDDQDDQDDQAVEKAGEDEEAEEEVEEIEEVEGEEGEEEECTEEQAVGQWRCL